MFVFYMVGAYYDYGYFMDLSEDPDNRSRSQILIPVNQEITLS